VSDRRAVAESDRMVAWMRGIEDRVTTLERRKLQGALAIESAAIESAAIDDLTVTTLHHPLWKNADVDADANIAYSKLEPSSYCKVGGSTDTLTTAVAAFLNFVNLIRSSPYLSTSGSNALLVNVTGSYLIVGSILWGVDVTPAGFRQIQLFAAGGAQALTIQSQAGAPASTNCATSTSVIVSLTAGDLIQLQALHTQGANKTLANDNRTFLSAVFLGTNV
jgi:hypothetical protein